MGEDNSESNPVRMLGMREGREALCWIPTAHQCPIGNEKLLWVVRYGELRYAVLRRVADALDDWQSILFEVVRYTTPEEYNYELLFGKV